MTRRGLLVLALLLTFGLPATGLAQAPPASDITPDVPELTAMHDVIHPIWHEAYPAKDIAALAAQADAVTKQAQAISRAVLPGVLARQDRLWREGVLTLTTTASRYSAAAKAKDEPALLSAAEAIHRDYERLVRLITPPMPEIGPVHSALYTLYRYYYEPLNLPKALETATLLKERMKALGSAAVPDRWKTRAEAINTQRTRLSAAIDTLHAVLQRGDVSRLFEAAESALLEYDKLEDVFVSAPRLP